MTSVDYIDYFLRIDQSCERFQEHCSTNVCYEESSLKTQWQNIHNDLKKPSSTKSKMWETFAKFHSHDEINVARKPLVMDIPQMHEKESPEHSWPDQMRQWQERFGLTQEKGRNDIPNARTVTWNEFLQVEFTKKNHQNSMDETCLVDHIGD